MNVCLRYNFDKICRVVLREQLDSLNVAYSITDSGFVNFHDTIPMHEYVRLHESLSKYGIEIVDNKKAILVQRIKALITAMLDKCDMPLVKISSYLEDQLQESYRTLAQIFSEVCHVTIENFIIIHKIERVKQMLLGEDISLTEISYKMNYSSVAHLSNQFKKITGLSPTTFQKLAQRRRRLKTSAVETSKTTAYVS